MELTEALERLIECARFTIDGADPDDVERHTFLFTVDSTEKAIEAVISHARSWISITITGCIATAILTVQQVWNLCRDTWR